MSDYVWGGPDSWEFDMGPRMDLYMIVRRDAEFPIGTIMATDDIDADGWAWTMYGPEYAAVRITYVNTYVETACLRDVLADEAEAATAKALRHH